MAEPSQSRSEASRDMYVPCPCPEHRGRRAHYKHRQRYMKERHHAAAKEQDLHGPMNEECDHDDIDEGQGSFSDNERLMSDTDDDDEPQHGSCLGSPDFQSAPPAVQRIFVALAEHHQTFKPSEVAMADICRMMYASLREHMSEEDLSLLPRTTRQVMGMFKCSMHNIQRIPVCPDCGILVEDANPQPDFKCICGSARVFRYI
jgi:hypothetical protein